MEDAHQLMVFSTVAAHLSFTRAAESLLLTQSAVSQPGSIEAIKELVKPGLGVSMMAEWVARAELSQRSLAWLPTPGVKLRRRWCVAAAGAARYRWRSRP